MANLNAHLQAASATGRVRLRAVETEFRRRSRSHGLEYDAKFASNAKHIHGAPTHIGDLLFTGFIRHETKWGRNPAWLASVNTLNEDQLTLGTRLQWQMQMPEPETAVSDRFTRS